MADFRKAFRSGLDAYNDAERARKEIFGLFDEFAAQIHEESHGRVRIERTPRSQAVPIYGSSRSPTLSARPGEGMRTRGYDAIVATGPSGQLEELCEYALGERGYPVNLRYAREDVRCHDREALEIGLQKLLAHPETGGKLQRLMGTEQAA
jgi:hypothetical protein